MHVTGLECQQRDRSREYEAFHVERFRRNNSFITTESMLQGNTQASDSKV